MQTGSNFTVIYDACVLYPAPLRDLLMHLALLDLFRARWSNMIHDEWIHNVHANRPDLSLERLEQTRSRMNHAVRDCVVTGFEHLMQVVHLPDQQDQHVVAAALHCSASLIVTFNLKDFPAHLLKPYNLHAQHPDDFLVDLLDLHLAAVLQAVANHRRSLKSPPKTAEQYLQTLLAQGMTQSAAVLRQWTVAI
jgi:hypothetical protein